MNKWIAYEKLVRDRKGCELCKDKYGYLNQSVLLSDTGESYDTNDIGNLSTWANDLEADLLIVAQDFSDAGTFKRDKGRIQLVELTEESPSSKYSTVTNFYLRELTKTIGRDIGLPPNTITTSESKKSKRIFLTNAVLCMKPGIMDSPVSMPCVSTCANLFLRKQIELVNPKAVVTLGSVPAMAVINLFPQVAFDLTGLKFGNIFLKHQWEPISLTKDGLMLFPMYHPSRQGQWQRKRIEPGPERGLDLMKKDWKRLGAYLEIQKGSWN